MAEKLICKICNKEYEIGRLMLHVKSMHQIETKDYYDKYLNSIDFNPNCPICGKPRKFDGFKKGYYQTCGDKTCSSKLININGKENHIKGCLERNKKWKNNIDPLTGLSEQQMIVLKGQDKRNEIMVETGNKISKALKIIGDDGLTPVQRSMLEKYGVDNAMHLDFVKEKISIASKENMPETMVKMKDTMMKRYGVEHAFSMESTKEKQRIYNLEKQKPILIMYFQENNLTLLDDPNDYKNINQKLNFICNRCGTQYSRSWSDIKTWWRCRKCFPNTKQEYEIGEFLDLYKINYMPKERGIIRNPSTGFALELDFFMPDNKVAIEFDGNWWHCSANGYVDNYHLNKTELCENEGIKLVHIFEDEWLFKRSIILSRLKNLLCIDSDNVINARDCKINRVSFKEKEDFLNFNHIQANDNSCLNIGLFYNNVLVSIMTFTHGSIAKGKKYNVKEWELSRFCSLINHRIVGGAAKLLSYFKNNFEWELLFTYCDRKWSWKKNNIYDSLGFVYSGNTNITCYYMEKSKPLKRYHRFHFLREQLEKLPNYDKTLSRHDNLINNGFVTIHDCGHLKYVLRK